MRPCCWPLVVLGLLSLSSSSSLKNPRRWDQPPSGDDGVDVFCALRWSRGFVTRTRMRSRVWCVDVSRRASSPCRRLPRSLDRAAGGGGGGFALDLECGLRPRWGRIPSRQARRRIGRPFVSWRPVRMSGTVVVQGCRTARWVGCKCWAVDCKCWRVECERLRAERECWRMGAVC